MDDATETTPAPAPARPRGTLARCVFAWAAGGLLLASVVLLGVSWLGGTVSARGADLPLPVLEVFWQAYWVGWIGTVGFTPLAAIASALVGGRQGTTAAWAGIIWLALFIALSTVFGFAADAMGVQPAAGWLYGATMVLLVGVVPVAVGVSTVLAATWRWRGGGEA